MAQQSDSAEALEARRKYAQAFNDTMLRIWDEQMYKLGVYDTGALVKSLTALPLKVEDPEYTKMAFEFNFREYGIYVDAGTGKEISKGNPGDIGREKVRQAKRWFSNKFYSSYRNILEFMARNLGEELAAVVSNALNDKDLRNNVT